MQLTEKQIKQFRVLYRKRFGEELSQKEAYRKALRLVNLVRAILQDNDN